MRNYHLITRTGQWCFLALLAFSVALSYAKNNDTENSVLDITATETIDQKKQWFRDAGFGMFIHFGAESPHPETFNPKKFDAREWVKVAKNAGAKYIVYTSKHHNGMSNWDTALTDWNVVKQTPFKRDIIQELYDAAKAEGIRLGLYYSIADWHHPQYDTKYSNRNGFHYSPNPNADIAKYMGFMYGQIQELCERFEPILFWFDGSAGFRPKDRKRMLGQQEMMDMLHECGALSNSRLGDDDALKYVDYLNTGDNMVPAGNIGVDFEVAGTMNESWHFTPEDSHWKSDKELLHLLVNIVGKGGNYLLNVGPTGLGLIPDESKARLKTIGKWLKKNGEAIYGADAGPYPHELSWGSMTQKFDGTNTELYLSVVDWPESGELELYGIDNQIRGATLLVSGKSLASASRFNPETGMNTLTITLPRKAPDDFVSVIKLSLVGKVVMDDSIIQQFNGLVNLDGYQAKIHDVEHIPGKPKKVIDYRHFTVMPKDEGIIPAHTMTVGGLTQVGQALSWDFTLNKPGSYDVAVISFVGSEGELVEESGRVRVTLAGQKIEGDLVSEENFSTNHMALHFKDSRAVLGRVILDSAGTHTLSLEVATESNNALRRIRSVQLVPVR